MAFVVKKRIDLSFLGEGWDQAYITFTPFSFGENRELLTMRKNLTNLDAVSNEQAEKLSDDMLEMLRKKFIEGMGFTGEKLEPITIDNFDELPMELFAKVIAQLQGTNQIPPKA